MKSDILNGLRGMTFSLEEADALHKAIDGRTRPQPAVVTPTHAGFSGDEQAAGEGFTVSGLATYLLNLEANLIPGLFAEEVKRLAKGILDRREDDKKTCDTAAPNVDKVPESWRVTLSLESEYGVKHPTFAKFDSEDEAYATKESLTEQINRAGQDDTLLVEFGCLSFRPEDVVSIEVAKS